VLEVSSVSLRGSQWTPALPLMPLGPAPASVGGPSTSIPLVEKSSALDAELVSSIATSAACMQTVRNAGMRKTVLYAIMTSDLNCCWDETYAYHRDYSPWISTLNGGPMAAAPTRTFLLLPP
jgi:hypothetical protein